MAHTPIARHLSEASLVGHTRARAAGGSLIVLCAHNGDELLATLRRATHEVVPTVISNVRQFVDELLRLKFARAFGPSHPRHRGRERLPIRGTRPH
jgi:hypothetical protein